MENSDIEDVLDDRDFDNPEYEALEDIHREGTFDDHFDIFRGEIYD